MSKYLLRPEALLYFSIAVFLVAPFILRFFTQGELDSDVLQYYFQVTGDKILLGALFLFVILFIRFFFLWLIAEFKGTGPSVLFSSQNLLHLQSSFFQFLKDILQVGLPFIILLYTLAFALDQLNVFNSTRLQDELLVQWDVLVTSTFPPLSLASFTYPIWFAKAVEISFVNLLVVFALLGAYLFQAKQKLFREAVGVFAIALLFLFAGWIIFPVMSPHDRFIDNVYNLSISSSAQGYIDNYHPQEEIQEFLNSVREKKEGLSVMSTSTMPSAHAAWAVLLVYYSWRARRWFIILGVPLVIFSTIGTVFFAQHYFVDIPVGIIVGIASIVLVHWLAKKRENAKIA